MRELQKKMKDNNKKKETEKANNVKLRKEGGRVRSRSPVRVSVEEEDVENNRKRRKDRNENKETSWHFGSDKRF